MDILEEAEKFLKEKQGLLFAWENPEATDIIVKDIYFDVETGKLYTEYVGR